MKGTLDDVRNMYDDETAEPLQPVYFPLTPPFPSPLASPPLPLGR